MLLYIDEISVSAEIDNTIIITSKYVLFPVSYIIFLRRQGLTNVALKPRPWRYFRQAENYRLNVIILVIDVIKYLCVDINNLCLHFASWHKYV